VDADGPEDHRREAVAVSVIIAETLSFSYPGSTFTLTVPKLVIQPGETVAIVGASGSGKTTLLHLLAGLKLRHTGMLSVLGIDSSTVSEPSRRANRLKQIGLVFQDFALLDYLNVLDNIVLPYRVSAALPWDATVKPRASELAATLGIADKLYRRIDQLSLGEKQRVAIARAMLTKPQLLLADEPTGNLDPANKLAVLDAMLTLAKAHGSAVLVVTHDHSLLGRFDRVLHAPAFNEGATA
jgi:putative ABC transport system ATP-binding protein